MKSTSVKEADARKRQSGDFISTSVGASDEEQKQIEKEEVGEVLSRRPCSSKRISSKFMDSTESRPSTSEPQ